MGGPKRSGARPGHRPRAVGSSEGRGPRAPGSTGRAAVRGVGARGRAGVGVGQQRPTKGKLLERLGEARLASDRAEHRLELRVVEAREFGLTWAEIGSALHRTGQAVGKRYGVGRD
jgi:hypothetical protein